MQAGKGDFELSMDELRVVSQYAVESAEEVLSVFEETNPEDLRPRLAIEAAWAFVHGAARTNVQRVTALDAHRAAKEVAGAAAEFAARSAGDAAAAAYLHPLAKATRVGHILRAAANAARAAELTAGEDPAEGEALIERARRRATPTLIDVLRRYPRAPVGKSRVAHLMQALDSSLCTPCCGVRLLRLRES
ncbi:putative immunity protein [Cryobacterium serini]|uniref:Exonuclease SbcC n=1 Tax=Cryobacterium serini TaxID=1259201 RepID=A0A4R9BSE4_9MICO|nr:exonuclease SbcC [Cryobacterium serini]TFD88919.1 exonuclease SbcC [Cryobacterium serini]